MLSGTGRQRNLEVDPLRTPRTPPGYERSRTDLVTVAGEPCTGRITIRTLRASR